MTPFFCFSQQTEEFKNVKNYYNQHRVLLNNEFRKKYEAETNVLNKDAIKRDFVFFMKKMDSIENTALVGALLKVKNLEDLNSIKNKTATLPETSPDITSSTGQMAEYPGGMNTLRQQVANLFYTEGVHSEMKTAKALVAFIVEKDGTISNVQASGDNFTFNRQAEIALYSVPQKFTPAVFNGGPVRYRFKLPLTMTIE
ncbi:energy transducer TonB [Chryseobacterium sp. JUb7]|uniref:energy transducer TonB n=1 Tax=Chryseobacterium sp. JUb7 TaxID=2940599 RepID=UPI00216738DA|nr:hypothetical protein [Chryseobacterium sp. JUb7]MCS3530029.1 hypothetical protein [Chryseobacterium sp. JUb7]